MVSVLVIDDDPDILELLSQILALDGHDVSTAGNGKEGMIACTQREFGLIITDIIMPEQEGIETILALRRTGCTVPIIAMSGGGRVSPEDYLETAIDLGVSATLRKPFDRKALQEAVKQALV